jgi:putative membrane protein
MMMGWILILPLLLIGIIAVALGWRPDYQRGQGAKEPPQNAVEILKARYARGEISRAEYEDMRRDLEM